MGFPGGSAGKEYACNMGDLVRSLGWEDPLEKNGKDTHSSLPASKESDRTERLSLSVFPGGPVVKKLPANTRDVGLYPWVGKTPWRRSVSH